MGGLHMKVLGHSKTILVLLGGWAFLGDKVSLKQLAGMALAVLGMVFYGVASSQCVPAPLSLLCHLASTFTLIAQQTS